MTLFDSHFHLYDDKYGNEQDEIIKNAHDNGVKYMVDIGLDEETSKIVIEQANKYEGLYCAIGMYPEYCNGDEIDLSFIEKLYNENQNVVVALGEIGLDYHGDDVNKENQKKHFIRQIEIANKLNLPICIHNREADMDMLEILKSHKVNKGFVMHCFSSSLEIAKEIIKLGGYISIAGPVTFKNARSLIDIAKFVPLDKLLIETDAPYLCPEPLRGRRNEPANVRFTAQKIADIKEMSLEEFVHNTTENAKHFYNIT
ncbi:MAG: TatD family hydrolase [Clostridia bacterium]|nr:TatD family hydrolase [Clostridia bacterium]